MLANDLLYRFGVTTDPIVSVEELQENASSMLVALCERAFGGQLPSIVRTPVYDEDYAANADVALAALRQQFPTDDIPHWINGQAFVVGNVRAIELVLRLLWERAVIDKDQDIGAAADASGNAASDGTVSDDAIGGAGSSSAPSSGVGESSAADYDAAGPVVDEEQSPFTTPEREEKPQRPRRRRRRRRVKKDGALVASEPAPARRPNASRPRTAHARPRRNGGAARAGRRRPASAAAPRTPHVGQKRGRNARTPKRSPGESTLMSGTKRHSYAAALHTGISPDIRRVGRRTKSKHQKTAVVNKLDREAAHRVQIAHRRAVRDRYAGLRLAEQQFVQRAVLRARAAEHERRVSTIRTKRLAQELRRETLAHRARRSSLQVSLSTKLLKAALHDEKMAALDVKRAAIADAEESAKAEIRRWQATQHEFSVRRDLLREQAAVQEREREIATKAQLLALRQANRDLASANLIDSALQHDETHQAEQRFLDEFVEPLDPEQTRGMAGNPAELLAQQTARLEKEARRQQARRRARDKAAAAERRRRRQAWS